MRGAFPICVLGLMTAGSVRADDVPWQPVHWLGRGGVWTSRAAVTVTNATTNDWQGTMRSLACPVDPSRADLRVVDAEGTPLLYRSEDVRLVLPVSAKAGTTARYYVYWDNPSAWRLGEFLKGTAVDDESAVWSPIERAAVRRIGDDAPWFGEEWEFRVPLRLVNFTDDPRGETLWTVHLPEIVHATPRAQVAVVFGGVRIKACRLGDKLLFSRSLGARCLETGYAYVRAGTAADEVRETRAVGQVVGQLIPSDQRDALVASLTGEDREAYRALCTGPANLLANASFEDPLVQDGAWTLNPKDCTIAAVTNGFFGARAVRIATETPDAPTRWRGLTQGVRAKPNRTYFFGGFLRTPGCGLFLTAHESDAEGRQIIHCPTLSSVASDEWQPVFGTLSADAAAARVQLDITTRSGGVFEADAMLLCESAEPLVGERAYRPGLEDGRGLVAGPVDTMVKVQPETLPEPAPCRFAAARREAESLQIAVRSGTPVARLQADCPALRHESGFEIPVTVLHVGYVPVDYPSGNYFLDGNLPPWTLKFPNSSVQSHGWSGLWPDPLFVTNVISLASGETQALRFRVKVPAEAPAGLYRGAIVWMADGREALRQPVELEVFGFAIPERPEAVTAFGMDHPDFVKYRTLAEYRASPTRIHASPKWSRDGKTGRLTVDFTDYDREAERYFNEFGFRESYFPREFFLFNWAHPLRKFLGVEPFDGKYPYADCDHRVLKPEYRRTLQEAVRLFWEHVRAKGWADRYTLYIADEPRVSVGYVIDQMKAVCDAVHEVAPEIRIYSSTWTHQPAWDDCLDIMGIGSNGGQFPTSAIAARRRKGKSCRFTTDGKFRIDTPLTNVERSETWYAAAWEVDGLEYWCAEFYTFDPLTHGYHGFLHESPAPGQMHWIRFPSGDGYVVYPGGIASLRLEAMRDGSEDFSYFQAVRRLDTPEARALLTELQAFVPMPNAGAPTDVMRFRELREKAARLLANRPPELKVGLLADIHLKETEPDRTDWFERALRYFDTRKADAVLIAGDLADYGLIRQLRLVGEAWRRVFPADRRSDGAPIEKLFIYGDHDTAGLQQKHCTYLPAETLEAEIIPNYGREKAWREAFGEDWSPVIVKDVKGYRFYLASHVFWKTDKAQVDSEALKTSLATAPADRPFFLVQHWQMPWTVGHDTDRVSWMGRDNGFSYNLVKDRPNAVALFGHKHASALDPANFWTNRFTAVEIPSLHRTYLPGEKGSSDFDPERDRRRECLFLNVYPDRLVFERLDARNGFVRLGADFVHDL